LTVMTQYVLMPGSTMRRHYYGRWGTTTGGRTKVIRVFGRRSVRS
jgi:hypothetical protein